MVLLVQQDQQEGLERQGPQEEVVKLVGQVQQDLKEELGEQVK